MGPRPGGWPAEEVGQLRLAWTCQDTLEPGTREESGMRMNEMDSLSWRFLVDTFDSNILQQFAVQTYLYSWDVIWTTGGTSSKLCTMHALFAGHAGNSAQKHSNGSASRDEPWCHGEPLKSTDLPRWDLRKGSKYHQPGAQSAQNMWRKAAWKIWVVFGQNTDIQSASCTTVNYRWSVKQWNYESIYLLESSIIDLHTLCNHIM